MSHQLPPGEKHRWRIVIDGEDKKPVTASSHYFAVQKAAVEHRVEPGQVEASLIEKEPKRGKRKGKRRKKR